jgi:hypothetical protein
MVFCTVPSAIQYIKAGTLRALAVTSATRLESMPENPTVGDTVPGFESAQTQESAGRAHDYCRNLSAKRRASALPLAGWRRTGIRLVSSCCVLGSWRRRR